MDCQLLQPLASAGKAQESLRPRIAERVYRSGGHKKAIEEMATGVGREVGKRIEAAAADPRRLRGPLSACRRFSGGATGPTAAGDRQRRCRPPTQRRSSQAWRAGFDRPGPCSGAVEGVAGADYFGQRDASSPPSRRGLRRISRLGAGPVGFGVVCGWGRPRPGRQDIWDFRHGVLPIVAEEMKFESRTRDKGARRTRGRALRTR
mgnify:CR=1 FL=1